MKKEEVDLADLHTEMMELRALIQTLWVITVDEHEEKPAKRLVAAKAARSKFFFMFVISFLP